MKKTILLIFLVFITATLPAQPCGCDPATEIVILHVNDMHGKTDAFPKLAYVVDSIRKEHKNVFLVSAGDNYSGNPEISQYKGRHCTMTDLMNRCGFDACALANHEFDAGQEQLANRMRQAKFPFLCCNIDASGGGIPQPKAYDILKAGKCKVALIGVVQRDAKGFPTSDISNFEGLSFSDGIEKMKEYAWLKDEYVVLVALSHLGIKDDIRLAKEMPQLDLIVGGHSHIKVDSVLIVNGVQIVQAGSKLEYIGMTRLHVEKGNVIFRKDTLLKLSSVQGVDPKILKMVRKK